MRNRVIIENLIPEVNHGKYYIKRTAGGGVVVSADIFADGHDLIRAYLQFKHDSEKNWQEIEMEMGEDGRWTGRFLTEKRGFYHYKVVAWVDQIKTWLEQLKKKSQAGELLEVELQIGANLLRKAAGLYPKKDQVEILDFAAKLETSDPVSDRMEMVLSIPFTEMMRNYPLRQFETEYDQHLRVWVGSHKGLFSSWYQLFPRSTSKVPGHHGTLKDVENLLPRIASLGFDVLYLPPIHPIGTTRRKGKNAAEHANPGDPGSPWAIGDVSGGHYSVHPELGTLEDFQNLIREAAKRDIDIAFDLAFQCSPDHPWLREHPDWFRQRPDGTFACSESPPFKYEDVIPFDFETEDWQNLWNELKKLVLFWVGQGIKIFRVAVPQTKPLPFWEWLITEVHKVEPDVIFLAAAFTQPKMIAALSKVGFTQSYTYFLWKTTRTEVEEYMKELTGPELRQYFRPNFWTNVPDVLPYYLMNGDSNVFALRLLLAATLSSNYGVYGPVFELMENSSPPNGKEEYLHSEKFEVRHFDWTNQNRLTYLMGKINYIRSQNPALQSTFNIHFTKTDNDEILSYVKVNNDLSNIIWCIVSFDTNYVQSGFVQIPKALFGIDRRVNLKVHDLLNDEIYHWFNDWNYVELNPSKNPMHVFRVEIIKSAAERI